MAPRKLIVDTDPGVDDILGLLLALTTLEEIDVVLISVTYGNTDLSSCAQNIVSLFYHIEKELTWRRKSGRALGFRNLTRSPPIVALGPQHPLDSSNITTDYFNGLDGLNNISTTHTHLNPNATWEQSISSAHRSKVDGGSGGRRLFVPSDVPAHKEMLQLLREHDDGEIVIAALGPLTNLATAAQEDLKTFLRVKEVAVMGGTIDLPGNITPFAECNTFADPVSAAMVYALTSQDPGAMLPVRTALASITQLHNSISSLYPGELAKKLNITLFPLDVTGLHIISRAQFDAKVGYANAEGSPLAAWASAFMEAGFSSSRPRQPGVNEGDVKLKLHDPLCIWYCVSESLRGWRFIQNEDIRVETDGQWTTGMCVADRRQQKRSNEVPGNSIRRCIGSPHKGLEFGDLLMRCIFGP